MIAAEMALRAALLGASLAAIDAGAGAFGPVEAPARTKR